MQIPRKLQIPKTKRKAAECSPRRSRFFRALEFGYCLGFGPLGFEISAVQAAARRRQIEFGLWKQQRRERVGDGNKGCEENNGIEIKTEGNVERTKRKTKNEEASREDKRRRGEGRGFDRERGRERDAGREEEKVGDGRKLPIGDFRSQIADWGAEISKLSPSAKSASSAVSLSLANDRNSKPRIAPISRI
jgi:hypothetical protein